MINPVIIIPAYNPPNTFSKLLINIRKITLIPIIIIDDGSNEKIYLETSINNIHLIRNKYNLGKGASLLNSFNYAQKHEYSHCITIDADNQHDPLLIDSFLNIQSSIEIVCGNRAFNFPMPLHRRISNILTSKICSVITGTNILDSQCGYRRYKIDKILNIKTIQKGYLFETEILIKSLRNGYKIEHINIPTIYLNEKSSIQYIADTMKFIKLILKLLIYKK